MTDAGVSAIAEKCVGLKTIGLEYCTGVNERYCKLLEAADINKLRLDPQMRNVMPGEESVSINSARE